MAFWNNKSKETHTFSDLIRGLQHSISSAMEMIESRNIEVLNKYFTDSGEPVTKKIHINQNTSLNVPLISIVNTSALNIKEVDLEFDVKVNDMDLKQKSHSAGVVDEDDEFYADRIERSSLKVSFLGGKSDSTMNVKIKFEAAPVPEGMSRIISEYDKVISPIKKSTED